MVVHHFCADSTCVPARANILAPAAPLSATFSNSLRAALELVVRKSISTGVSCKQTHIHTTNTAHKQTHNLKRLAEIRAD